MKDMTPAYDFDFEDGFTEDEVREVNRESRYDLIKEIAERLRSA